MTDHTLSDGSTADAMLSDPTALLDREDVPADSRAFLG